MTVMSKNQKIRSLTFRKVPRRLVGATVIKVDGLTVVMSRNGELYCDAIAGYAFLPGAWPWQEPLMKALVKLGVVSQDDVDGHMACADAAEARSERRAAADAISRHVETLGLKLTKVQLKRIEAASGSPGT